MDNLIGMTVLCVFVIVVSATATGDKRSGSPRLRLRHGPNKELILQRDVEEEEIDQDSHSIRKRCNCYCHSKAYRNDWSCCPCPWTTEVCFPGDVSLELEDGRRIMMKNLRAGHRVKTVSSDEGRIIYTEVKTFLKRRPLKSALYLTIYTQDGYSLTLSGRHLVYVAYDNDTLNMHPRFAQSVQPGDYLFTTSNCVQTLCPALVTDIQPVVREGTYVPLTDEGTLIIDDIYTSCYSSINHVLAHAFTTPFRWFPWLLSPWQEDGYSPLVDWMKQIGHMILPANLQFQVKENAALPEIIMDL